MSIFVSCKAIEAENRKYKRSNRTMKRIRQPTQLKSKKCSLEEYHGKCKPGIYKVVNYILCEEHYAQYKLKTEKFKPNYFKSNNLS